MWQEVTRMLQSIQYVGSGPPTYVYSHKAVGASGEYYHVFAAETRGYDSRREKKERENEERLRELYQKEYGRRESFLWKQK